MPEVRWYAQSDVTTETCYYLIDKLLWSKKTKQTRWHQWPRIESASEKKENNTDIWECCVNIKGRLTQLHYFHSHRLHLLWNQISHKLTLCTRTYCLFSIQLVVPDTSGQVTFQERNSGAAEEQLPRGIEQLKSHFGGKRLFFFPTHAKLSPFFYPSRVCLYLIK